MPQRYMPPTPVGGAGAGGEADVIMKALPTMAQMYLGMARLNQDAAQSGADRYQRGKIASAQIGSGLVERAMGIDAQMSMQQQEIAARQQAQEQEFQQRMAIRQMELSLPEQMDMQQRQHGIAHVRKMISEGRLKPEQGQPLIDMMEGGLNMYQAQQIRHQMATEEMNGKRMDAQLKHQAIKDQETAAFYSKGFSERTAMFAHPRVKMEVAKEMEPMFQMGNIPPEAREAMIMAEVDKRGGMRHFYQDKPGSWMPLDEATGDDQMVKMEETKIKNRMAEEQKLRDDWYAADKAVRETIHKDIAMRREIQAKEAAAKKAAAKDDLEGGKGEVTIESKPSTWEDPVEADKIYTELMRRHGFEPTWGGHLQKIKQQQGQQQGGMPNVGQLVPQQGSFPIPQNLGGQSYPRGTMSRADAPVEQQKAPPAPPETVGNLRKAVESIDKLIAPPPTGMKTPEMIDLASAKAMLAKPDVSEQDLKEVLAILMQLREKYKNPTVGSMQYDQPFKKPAINPWDVKNEGP